MIRLVMIGIPGEYGKCLISSLKFKGVKILKIQARKNKNFSRKVIMLLRSWKPDIVHIQFFEGSYRNIGPVIGVGILPVYKYCKIRKIPVVTTFHEVPHPARLELFFKRSPFFLNRIGIYRKFKICIRKLIYEWIIKNSSAVIVHTREHETLLKSWGYTNIHWIPHGTEIVNLRGKRSIDRFTLVSFGAFRTDKRYDIVFEALKALKCRPITYIVHASTPEDEISRKWLKYIESIKPEDVVIIKGFLPKRRLLELITCADAVLFPYDKVGMGASSGFHHAIGLGKPVIAPNIGEFKDWGDYVLLYRCNDVEDLRRSIMKMMDEQIREHYAALSRELAELTRWDRVAEKHISLYLSFI